MISRIVSTETNCLGSLTKELEKMIKIIVLTMALPEHYRFSQKKSILQFVHEKVEIFCNGCSLNFKSMLWCIIYIVHNVFKNNPL